MRHIQIYPIDCCSSSREMSIVAICGLRMPYHTALDVFLSLWIIWLYHKQVATTQGKMHLVHPKFLMSAALMSQWICDVTLLLKDIYNPKFFAALPFYCYPGQAYSVCAISL